MTDEQRDLLTAALEHLRSNAAEVFSIAAIREIMGQDGVNRVKERRGEYVAANKAASDLGSMLSADARGWWTEAQQTLAYGRLALSKGSRRAEKALSRMCEKMEESFEARVSVRERGMFKIHNLDGTEWDDRWHYCVDHSFPLLRDEVAAGPLIANTMREAQISVLSETLNETI